MRTPNGVCGRALAVAALAMLAAASPADAQSRDKTFQLKISHTMPPNHPLQKALEDWGAAVEKASGGTLKYAMFPAGQLGYGFVHYDLARDGLADLTFVNPGLQPGRFPVIAAGELPFLMSDAKGGSMALDAWYRKYAAGEMKDVKFCLAFIQDPGSFHSNKKIVLPSDIRGLKVRPAHATLGTFVSQLGGTNVQSSASEVPDILEKGVADSVTFPWGLVVQFGVDKVTKFHMDAPLYATTFAFVFSKDRYEQLSATQKKAVDDNCTTEMAGKVGGPWGEFEHAGLAKVKAEAGHDVYSLSADQLAQWRKAAEPLENSWADGARKVGVDPVVAMKELKDQLAKYNALYDVSASLAVAAQPKPGTAEPPSAISRPAVTTAAPTGVAVTTAVPTGVTATAAVLATPGRRVALAIGNARYTGLRALRNPVNDANDIAAALRGLGFEVSTGIDLNRIDMENMLIKFAREARQAATALVYYSGHGLQHQGVNYLAPIDTVFKDEADLRRLIKLQDVIGDLQNASRVRILIVDACRDNQAVEFAGNFATTRTVALERGFARAEARGTLVAYATQPNRVADDGSGRNSPFTRALLKHLPTAGLELRTLLTRVRADVDAETNGGQLPEVSDSLIGEFVLKAGP